MSHEASVLATDPPTCIMVIMVIIRIKIAFVEHWRYKTELKHDILKDVCRQLKVYPLRLTFSLDICKVYFEIGG